jgi:PAS domain S-box-containing protein
MPETEKTKTQFLYEIEEIPALVANLEREALERQKLVEIFRASESKLRLLRDQVPAAIWTTDKDLRFTGALGAGLAALGLDPAQSIGVSLAEYFQARDSEAPPLAAAARGLNGESASYEFTRSGRVFLVRVEPLRDAEGQVAGTVNVAVDISERCEVEAALRAAEARFRSLFEEAPVPYHEIDCEGKITCVNLAETRLLGLQPGDIVGRPIWSFVPSERQEEIRAAVQKEIRGEQPLTPFECDFVKQDGSRFTLEMHACLKRDAEGNPAGMRVASLDVTERNRNAEEVLRRENELRQSEQQARENDKMAWALEKAALESGNAALAAEKAALEIQIALLEKQSAEQKASLEKLEHEYCRARKALDLANDGVGLTDMAGLSVYYNPAFLGTYGYSLDELSAVGGAAAIFVNPEIAGQVAACIQQGQPWSGEVEMKTKDGRVIPTALRAEAVLDPAGNPIGLAVVCTDATDRKRSELYESERKKVAELLSRIEPLEKVLGQLSALAGRGK